MDEATFEKKLDDLVNQINSIPEPQKKKIILLARQSHKSHKELKKSMNNLQDSLDYLRVCVKYLLFDIEATKRENKYLRRLIDEGHKQ